MQGPYYYNCGALIDGMGCSGGNGSAFCYARTVVLKMVKDHEAFAGGRQDLVDLRLLGWR